MVRHRGLDAEAEETLPRFSPRFSRMDRCSLAQPLNLSSADPATTRGVKKELGAFLQGDPTAMRNLPDPAPLHRNYSTTRLPEEF